MKNLTIICVFIFITTILISAILSNNMVSNMGSHSNQCSIGEIHYTETINGVSTSKCIGGIFPFLLFFTVFMVIFNLPLNSIYFFVFFIYRTHKVNNKLIKDENLIYQRELPDYNCAVASYILDGIIDVERDVEALLLELKEENVITMTPEKIEVNKDMMKKINKKQYHNSTQYLLWTIAYTQPFSKKVFKDKVIQDAKELGFAKESGRMAFIYIISFLFCNIPVIVLLIVLAIVDKKNGLLTELYYKLTKEGGLEKDKLLKLKKFLISFSTIDELKTIENNIWGRYVPFYLVMKE